jgi:CxxC motif-containing protein (DUF1111 family)
MPKLGLPSKSIGILVGVSLFAWFGYGRFYIYAPDVGKLGGPIEGLSPSQLQKFYECKTSFTKSFTANEGLGPFYNGTSCYECHGAPGIAGGQGRDPATTGITRFGKLNKVGDIAEFPLSVAKSRVKELDLDFLESSGGPTFFSKSTLAEFKPAIPIEADLISKFQAPALFGVGLINAISDRQLEQNEFQQIDESPEMAGRTLDHIDPLTRKKKTGKFGYKDGEVNLMLMTAQMLSRGLGITTSVNPQSSFVAKILAGKSFKNLPPEPNDLGKLMVQLTYFQSLLAPPPAVPLTKEAKHGQEVFARLHCAVCHVPEMLTRSEVNVVDPDSPVPELRHLEIKALENKTVNAYTDLLVHNMGVDLADGLPDNRATGGEWRTAPLWGLRFKKYFLHDGRTTDLEAAIKAHGGQAQSSKQAFLSLSKSDKEDLLAFLRSL